MPEPTPPVNERRASVRHRCADGPLCRLGAAQRYECRWGRLYDVSTTGLGLQIGNPLDPGRRLSLEVQEPDGGTRCVLEAQVVHSTDHGDGTWTVGCRLDVPLGEEEVRGLL